MINFICRLSFPSLFCPAASSVPAAPVCSFFPFSCTGIPQTTSQTSPAMEKSSRFSLPMSRWYAAVSSSVSFISPKTSLVTTTRSRAASASRRSPLKIRSPAWAARSSAQLSIPTSSRYISLAARLDIHSTNTAPSSGTKSSPRSTGRSAVSNPFFSRICLCFFTRARHSSSHTIMVAA